jgi:hypothetical protein
MSRKKSRPISWLAAIRVATAAFTGEARLVEDRWVPATETAFRGAGYRLTAEITPQRSLFGPLPDSTVRLQDDTKRAPDRRLSLEAPRFPPDTLRKEAYWEYAQSDVVQPVLVLLAEPAVVRLLTGPDDDLPEAVLLIHRWTTLAETEQKAVLTDLSKPAHDPVAYVAGFELLMSTTSDLPALVDAFLSLPGRPGAATQGILNELYRAASSLSKPEIKVLARQLLASWTQEVEPNALLGYLTWFDAHRQAWGDEPGLKTAVVAEAERVEALSFQGPDASAWQQRVQQQAAFLLPSSDNDV